MNHRGAAAKPPLDKKRYRTMTEQEKYEQFLELRRYGEIIVDIDKKINNRLYRVLMIKYNDDIYISILRDGGIVSIERI